MQKSQIPILKNSNLHKISKNTSPLYLLDLLKDKQKSEEDLNNLLTELQSNYDQLLVKYASAENFIDEMRTLKNDYQCQDDLMTMPKIDSIFDLSSECNNYDSAKRQKHVYKTLDFDFIESTHESPTFQKYFSYEKNSKFQNNIQKSTIIDDRPDKIDFSIPDLRSDSGFNGSVQDDIFADVNLNSIKNAELSAVSSSGRSSASSQILTAKINPDYFYLPSSKPVYDELDANRRFTSSENFIDGQKQIPIRSNDDNIEAKFLGDTSVNHFFEGASRERAKTSTPKYKQQKIRSEEISDKCTSINIYCYPSNDSKNEKISKRFQERPKSVKSMRQNDLSEVINYLDSLNLEAKRIKKKSKKVLNSLRHGLDNPLKK